MLDERSPDEPEEFDPAERFGDPERDLPADLGSQTVPDPSSNDVPKEVATAFWSTVILVNVGLFGVSLGAMLVYFRGMVTVGGAGVLVGAGALVHAYTRYRRFEREQASGGEGTSAAADGADGGDDSDGDGDPPGGRNG